MASVRSLSTNMDSYLVNLVEKFQKEYKPALRRVTTPFATDVTSLTADEEPGIFQASAASYVASGLYAPLVARPDLCVPIQRLCGRVTRWTVSDDISLIRLMAYIKGHHDYELVGALAAADLDCLELVIWCDADWNGDHATTKSTSGLFVELAGVESGNRFPLTWKASHQTATASSSAESETVSASSAIRLTALPIQSLLLELLGQLVPIAVRIDNTQAISAIKKGYSKRLRSLSRTHRCSIGVLNELYEDPNVAMHVEYHETTTHKGDFFTKCLPPASFMEARSRVGMRRIGSAVR